jgi:hypothetical protein
VCGGDGKFHGFGVDLSSFNFAPLVPNGVLLQPPRCFSARVQVLERVHCKTAAAMEVLPLLPLLLPSTAVALNFETITISSKSIFFRFFTATGVLALILALLTGLPLKFINGLSSSDSLSLSAGWLGVVRMLGPEPLRPSSSTLFLFFEPGTRG